MFACNGILFNHGGIRRGHNFVERKITLGLGKIIRGETDRLVMGNIDAKRDIGNAQDYVEAQWKILQQKKPGDYVIATGTQHTVKQFINQVHQLGKPVRLWASPDKPAAWEQFMQWGVDFINTDKIKELADFIIHHE